MAAVPTTVAAIATETAVSTKAGMAVDEDDDLLLGLWCEELFISKNETEFNNLTSFTPTTKQNKMNNEKHGKCTIPANFTELHQERN